MLLLILAAPATIRVRRRSQRLSTDGAAEDQVESAWAEIRDTVVDHGGAWPEGSPRSIGQEVSTRLDGEEAASMGRVATLVERARYAQTFTDTEAAAELPTVTQEIRRGIAAPLGPVAPTAGRGATPLALPPPQPRLSCSANGHIKPGRTAVAPAELVVTPAGRVAERWMGSAGARACEGGWLRRGVSARDQQFREERSRSLRRGACATALPSCP